MRIVTVKMAEDMVEELDQLAIKLGLPRSELIRRAIKEYLKRERPSKTGIKVIRLYT